MRLPPWPAAFVRDNEFACAIADGVAFVAAAEAAVVPPIIPEDL